MGRRDRRDRRDRPEDRGPVVQDRTVAREGGGTIRTVVYADGSGWMEEITPDGQVHRSEWT